MLKCCKVIRIWIKIVVCLVDKEFLRVLLFVEKEILFKVGLGICKI